MSKSRVVSRTITSSRPSHMTLNLECQEDALSEVQLMARVKLKENIDRVNAALEDMKKEHNAQLVCQSGPVTGFQYVLPTSAPTALTKTTSQALLNVNQNKPQSIKLNMLNNANSPQGNIQLVVDPRVGVILSPVTSQQQVQASVSTTPTITVAAPSQSDSHKFTRTGRRTKVLQVQQQPDVIEEPSSTSQGARPLLRPKPVVTTHVVTPTTNNGQGVTNLRVKTLTNKVPAPVAAPIPVRPTEDTSIGGIAVGNKNAAAEQTDETKRNQPDGREFTFNKTTGGRTYPSLVVVARPNLRVKEITPQIAQKERSELDMKVKSVLMFSAAKFAEWLIQQGLVRSEQYCSQHSNNYQKTKLKLGMYSDSGTFPYSGGYVWISSCCPDRFVSVFCGSIFQGAPYSPTVLLKLIYHWACQTNVQNVVSWVKVTNFYVKNFYTTLRSICSAAVWEKSRMMGGKNSRIQVGVISLGTTSQDGNLRQVKVEVLGILDPDTSEIRLRACDPVYDGERSYKRRFNNILHPLREWVHKDSRILTDFTVDKGTMLEMGFSNITQSTFTEQNPRNHSSNYQIMEYLRKIVPRMFQNTLSLLSRPMIQQFLDELVWRENFGVTAARTFDNIIQHIAEQTRVDGNDSLPDRLSKIAANPFQDWSYSHKNPPPLTPMVTIPMEHVPSNNESLDDSDNSGQMKQGTSRNKRKRPHGSTNSDPDAKRIATPDSRDRSEKMNLQEYYYATMEGDKNLLLKEHKGSLYFKCFLCTATMRSNTEVMEHMVSHVPPQVPGQSESPVCRYCCTAFSSNHQMVIHVTESHSNFGGSDGDMVVCGICEQKFGTASLLITHMSVTHTASEMPYKCESCGYRTSSHKNVIDHYYEMHEKGEGLQCPYCLKVIQFGSEGNSSTSSVHAFLLHMQRHVVRREEGRGNKCSRCCLWFNQKSSLKVHQRELHNSVTGAKVTPFATKDNTILMPKQRSSTSSSRFDDSPIIELPDDDKVRKWVSGPIKINAPTGNLSCQECEEDIDEIDHYPGEQKCHLCRYVTCCWRAFKEHQQQIHNERPKTSLVVPSPLINIPLENKMQCPCGFSSTDGNQLASHLVKCKRRSAYPIEELRPSGIIDSLGLVPKSSSEVTEESTEKQQDQRGSKALTKRRKTTNSDLEIIAQDVGGAVSEKPKTRKSTTRSLSEDAN